MGDADCNTAVISNAQRYNMHNMHIETQSNKQICKPINKHITNKREPKANICILSTLNLELLLIPDNLFYFSTLTSCTHLSLVMSIFSKKLCQGWLVFGNFEGETRALLVG